MYNTKAFSLKIALKKKVLVTLGVNVRNSYIKKCRNSS